MQQRYDRRNGAPKLCLCANLRGLICNGVDTGFNVTRRKGEPTSDRWYVARKLGEPLMWEKANERCTTGVCTLNIVEKHVQRLRVGIAKVARGAFRVRVSN